jgi:hypothetical protein
MKHSKKTSQPGPVYRVRSIDGGWKVFDRDEQSVSEMMRTQADGVVTPRSSHAATAARKSSSMTRTERSRVNSSTSAMSAFRLRTTTAHQLRPRPMPSLQAKSRRPQGAETTNCA